MKSISFSVLLRSALSLLLVFILFFPFSFSVFSQETSGELEAKKQEIEQLKAQLEQVQGQKQTLSSTVNYLNNKIKLTTAQIDQSQQQIETLKGQVKGLNSKISDLDLTLEETTNLLVHRIGNTYKRSRQNTLVSLFSSRSLSQFVSQYKYLQTSQKHDRDIIFELEEARTNFQQQKEQKQEKQQELDELTQQYEIQKQVLGAQQEEKQQLLEVTKNDEKRFQAELARALAELEAIQAIIAGNGDETEVGSVSEGDTIAQIIPSASPCSSGAHLHFEVVDNGAHTNPFNFLSNIGLLWDNSDSPVSGSGSWRWPLNDPIRITQGYGHTSYSSIYTHGIHTGIDMVSDDHSVKAVKSGTLYRGAIACGGGTLRFVHVKHDGDPYNTYYLHVNY